MKPSELKHSALFQLLKKNKKAQQAFLRLGKTEDWYVLKHFVMELKQALLEATLEVDSIEEIKRYKHLIRGFESVVLLPKLVNDVREIEKKDKVDMKEKEREAERKKYNPGVFIRSAVRKIKGGKK